MGSVEVGRGISVVNVDGSGRTRLADGGEPASSSDGKRIAYAVTHARGLGIYVDGSAQRPITNLDDRSGFPSAPAWSPDGRMTVFAHNDTIFCGDVEGGDVRQLVTVGDRAACDATGRSDNDLGSRRGTPATPRWSPDGGKIVLALWESPTACSIWVMNANGTDEKELTDNNACDSAFAWQPRPS